MCFCETVFNINSQQICWCVEEEEPHINVHNMYKYIHVNIDMNLNKCMTKTVIFD